MKHVIAIILALSASIACAQSEAPNLAPPLAYSYTPGEGFKAPSYPALNRVASTDGASLSLQSASYMPGKSPSTLPKQYPARPHWSAYEYLPSGVYTASWKLLMTCPAAGEAADGQATIVTLGPMQEVTHYSLLASGVPREFTKTIEYTRRYANEAFYFTFQLNANPVRDASGKPRFGCRYTLSNLSLTAQ